MSVLDRNWTIYTDPIHDEESVGKLMGASEPAGADLEFRVKTIEKLQWLHEQAARGGFPAAASLMGLFQGKYVASFRGFQFQVLEGYEQITPGAYDVEGLPNNEAYEEFLLGLTWRSDNGWKSEMHVLGLAADEDIELLPEKAK